MNTQNTIPPIHQMHAHMTWCALTALYISRREGEVPHNNRVATNKHIARWASLARKQNRFGVYMNTELLKWESNGTRHAAICNLEKSLTVFLADYEKTVNAHSKLPKSFKQRIVNASAALNELNWAVTIGLERDWKELGRFEPEHDHSAFILAEHMVAFDDNGNLDNPISLMVISNNVQQAINAFYENGILLFKYSNNKYKGKKQYIFEIFPGNNGSKNHPPCKPS